MNSKTRGKSARKPTTTTRNNGDSMGSGQEKSKVQAPAGNNSQSASSSAVVAPSQSLSRTSNAPPKFLCRIDGCKHASFTTVEQLNEHIKAHSEQVKSSAIRVFKCLHKGCERHQYASEEKLNKHNLERHAVGDREEATDMRRMFKCAVPGCGRRQYRLQEGLDRHMAEEHSAPVLAQNGAPNAPEDVVAPAEVEVVAEVVAEEPKLFQCTHPGCTRSFPKHHGMRRHLATHKAMIKQEVVEEAEPEEQEMEGEEMNTFNCAVPRCHNRAFNTIELLYKHIARTHPEVQRALAPAAPAPNVTAMAGVDRGPKPFKCALTGCVRRQYKTQAGLDKHNAECHPAPAQNDPPARAPAAQDAPSRAPEEVVVPVAQEVPRQFQCTHPGCHLSFGTQGGMRKHLGSHKVTVKKEPVEPDVVEQVAQVHKCTFPGCQSRVFATAEYLHRHVLGKHPQLHREVVAAEEPKPAAQIPDQEPEVVVVERPKMFQCTHPGCPRSFPKHQGMRRHLTVHKTTIKKEVVEEAEPDAPGPAPEPMDVVEDAPMRRTRMLAPQIHIKQEPDEPEPEVMEVLPAQNQLIQEPEVMMEVEEAPQMFQCTYPGCTRSFPKHHGMRRHLANHKVMIKQEVVEVEEEPDAPGPASQPEVVPNPFTCTTGECNNKTFCNKWSLERHMMNLHGVGAPQEAEPVDMEEVSKGRNRNLVNHKAMIKEVAEEAESDAPGPAPEPEVVLEVAQPGPPVEDQAEPQAKIPKLDLGFDEFQTVQPGQFQCFVQGCTQPPYVKEHFYKKHLVKAHGIADLAQNPGSLAQNGQKSEFSAENPAQNAPKSEIPAPKPLNSHGFEDTDDEGELTIDEGIEAEEEIIKRVMRDTVDTVASADEEEMTVGVVLNEIPCTYTDCARTFANSRGLNKHISSAHKKIRKIELGDAPEVAPEQEEELQNPLDAEPKMATTDELLVGHFDSYESGKVRKIFVCTFEGCHHSPFKTSTCLSEHVAATHKITELIARKLEIEEEIEPEKLPTTRHLQYSQGQGIVIPEEEVDDEPGCSKIKCPHPRCTRAFDSERDYDEHYQTAHHQLITMNPHDAPLSISDEIPDDPTQMSSEVALSSEASDPGDLAPYNHFEMGLDMEPYDIPQAILEQQMVMEEEPMHQEPSLEDLELNLLWSEDGEKGAEPVESGPLVVTETPDSVKHGVNVKSEVLQEPMDQIAMVEEARRCLSELQCTVTGCRYKSKKYMSESNLIKHYYLKHGIKLSSEQPDLKEPIQEEEQGELIVCPYPGCSHKPFKMHRGLNYHINTVHKKGSVMMKSPMEEMDENPMLNQKVVHFKQQPPPQNHSNDQDAPEDEDQDYRFPTRREFQMDDEEEEEEEEESYDSVPVPNPVQYRIQEEDVDDGEEQDLALYGSGPLEYYGDNAPTSSDASQNPLKRPRVSFADDKEEYKEDGAPRYAKLQRLSGSGDHEMKMMDDEEEFEDEEEIEEEIVEDDEHDDTVGSDNVEMRRPIHSVGEMARMLIPQLQAKKELSTRKNRDHFCLPCLDFKEANGSCSNVHTDNDKRLQELFEQVYTHTVIHPLTTQAVMRVLEDIAQIYH